MDTTPTEFQYVSDAYERVWQCYVFTNIHMFEYLLGLIPASSQVRGSQLWEVFLGSGEPSLAQAGVTLDSVKVPTNQQELNIWKSLWHGNSGVCTSFALKIADEVGSLRRFTYEDGHKHRVAWQVTTKDVTLIDSSERKALQINKNKIKPDGLEWKASDIYSLHKIPV